jgi:hypothetical protein
MKSQEPNSHGDRLLLLKEVGDELRLDGQSRATSDLYRTTASVLHQRIFHADAQVILHALVQMGVLALNDGKKMGGCAL